MGSEMCIRDSLLTAQQKDYGLINAKLIDGYSPKLQSNMTVLVSNGEIVSIKKQGRVSSNYQIIDLNGMVLLPGFIDAHTHIRSLDAAKRAMESGVTTARSASTPNYQDVAIREMVKASQFIGPDIAAAGVFVTPNLGETILADTRLGVLLSLIHI